MTRIPVDLRPSGSWLAAVLLVAWASSGAAQTFPARFAVAGVAEDDVLNIRAAPSASAPVLDVLSPHAKEVEILGFSPDRAWARLGLPEGEGWVARRFLAEEPVEDPRRPPIPFRCLGTEPFWSLSVGEADAVLETPDAQARPLRPIGQAEGFRGFVLAFDDGGQTRDLTVVRAECSDGMSDRPYGFTALVWSRGEEVLEGCCFLLP